MPTERRVLDSRASHVLTQAEAQPRVPQFPHLVSGRHGSCLTAVVGWTVGVVGLAWPQPQEGWLPLLCHLHSPVLPCRGLHVPSLLGPSHPHKALGIVATPTKMCCLVLHLKCPEVGSEGREQEAGEWAEQAGGRAV